MDRDELRKAFTSYQDETKFKGYTDEITGLTVALVDPGKNEITQLVRKVEDPKNDYDDTQMAFDLMMLMVCVPELDAAKKVIGFEKNDGKPHRIFERADQDKLQDESHKQGGWVDRLIIECGNARNDFILELYGEKTTKQLKELAGNAI